MATPAALGVSRLAVAVRKRSNLQTACPRYRAFPWRAYTNSAFSVRAWRPASGVCCEYRQKSANTGRYAYDSVTNISAFYFAGV